MRCLFIFLSLVCSCLIFFFLLFCCFSFSLALFAYLVGAAFLCITFLDRNQFVCCVAFPCALNLYLRSLSMLFRAPSLSLHRCALCFFTRLLLHSIQPKQCNSAANFLIYKLCIMFLFSLLLAIQIHIQAKRTITMTAFDDDRDIISSFLCSLSHTHTRSLCIFVWLLVVRHVFVCAFIFFSVQQIQKGEIDI